MAFYRPKSFLKLVLLGFSLVMLPLIVAVVYATFSVDNLAVQSRRAIYRAVQVMQASRTLGEYLTTMERHVKQFQVLEDVSFFQAYAETHQKFQQVILYLAVTVLDEAQERHLSALADREQTLFDALLQHQRQPEQLKTLTHAFVTLTEQARAVLAETDKITDREAALTAEMATKTQRWLLWQAAAVIPGAVLFSAIFIALISRPIRQIDQAIHHLGAGEFTTSIRITGPRDLEYLGERLNWLRQRLLELEEEKRKFLRHVSHELKTPLTAIREGTALLAEGVVGRLDEAQHEVVGILQENSIHLQKLIEDLLTFHHAQARHTALNLTPVRLDRVLDEVAAAHKLAMKAKDIALELISTPVSVLGDEEKLHVAVDNLLSNAVKFAPPAGKISLHLIQEAGRAVVDIQDTGPGIARHEQDKVFEAFYQGATLYVGHIKGSGLGLAIAKEYVTAHHGTIDVIDDLAPGAHFRMTLPVATGKEKG